MIDRSQAGHGEKKLNTASEAKNICDDNTLNVKTFDLEALKQADKVSGTGTHYEVPTNNKPTIHIPMKFNGIEVSALLDTGAEITVINKELVERFQIKTTEKIPVKGINADSKILADFCPELKFEIQNTEIIWHGLAVPMDEDVILGLDFMIENDMDILITKGVVCFGQDYINFCNSKDNKLSDAFEINRVKIEKTIKLPPLSGKIIKVPIKCHRKSWKVFEPKPQVGVYIPNALVHANEKKIKVLVVNVTENIMEFALNDTLGMLSDTDEPDFDEKSQLKKTVFVKDVNLGAKNYEKCGYLSETCENKKQSIDEINMNDLDVSKEIADEANKIVFTIRKIAEENYIDHFPALESPDFDKIKNSLPNHIQDLFQRSCNNVTVHQAVRIAYLLLEYSSTFSKHDLDIGRFTEIKHRIKLAVNTVIRQKMRQTPFHFQAEEQEHLRKMLELGVISESQSDFANPVHIVRKKCGGMRYCIDFRALNAITVRDAYPLPLISECMDTLAGSVWYSSVDMASGYWQIELEKEDKHKTAFLTRWGLYEFNRLPFGLASAPASFCRAVQVVLRSLMWCKAVSYLDDVTVIASNFDEAVVNLREVLARFEKYNLKLKPKKCQLFQLEIEFLGHVVNAEGISIKPDHIKIMEKWPVPKTKKELQQFLGFANYFRGHIPYYAAIAQPLYDVITNCKGKAVELTVEQIDRMNELKGKLCTAPVLNYARPEHSFILDVDASNSAIGGCLSQIIDGKERAITYASFALTAAQRRYCTTRRELLSVLRFTRYFRHYLLGKKFVCRTDHNSLVWLLGFKNIEGQLSRWLEELAEYDFVLIHRPGKDHVNADVLSRLTEDKVCFNYTGEISPDQLKCHPCHYCSRAHNQWDRFLDEVDYVIPLTVRTIEVSQATPTPAQIATWVPNYTAEELRQLQINDAELVRVIDWLETEFVPDQQILAMAGQSIKHLWRLKDQLFFKEGVLFYKWEDALEPRNLLLVPKSLRDDVLSLSHDDILSGHRGRTNTIHTIKRSFFWTSIFHDVEVYIKSCYKCSKNKAKKFTYRAPMVLFQAGYPMQRVHIDIMGPFTKSRSGNVYVLMIVDQFTRWLECFALPDQTAEKVADKAVKEFFCRLGFPEIIHSDQGANFTSTLFSEMCRMLSIVKTRTLPYSPASNGQIERYNKCVLDMIRCLSKDVKAWDEYLPFISSAIRSMVHKTTGFTSNYLMFGREVNKPIDILYGVERDSFSSEVEYVKHLDDVICQSQFLARKHIEGSMRTNKRAYDKKIKEHQYNKGDFVYKIRESGKKGLSRKLLSLYEGPFVVSNVIRPVLVCIQGRKRSSYVHHNKLKPCNDRHIPLWLRRKRQELLGLDDTIPYDIAEQSDAEEGIGDLFEIDPPQPSTSGGAAEGVGSPVIMPGGDDYDVPVTSDKTAKKHVYAKQAQNRIPAKSNSVTSGTVQSRSGRNLAKPSYLQNYDLD